MAHREAIDQRTEASLQKSGSTKVTLVPLTHIRLPDRLQVGEAREGARLRVRDECVEVAPVLRAALLGGVHILEALHVRVGGHRGDARTVHLVTPGERLSQ